MLVPLEFAHSLRHWSEWVVFLVMIGSVGMSVTCGYHRLFSHRAYQARWPVRLAMLCLGAASFENSALQWVSDHRIHHRCVDQGEDPYSIRKGFWYAHWIWVMEARTLPISGVADLEKDPLVMLAAPPPPAHRRLRRRAAAGDGGAVDPQPGRAPGHRRCCCGSW